MANKNPSPATRFQPGNSGRPKEARDKLSRAFLEGLAADFEKNGKAALVRVRKEDPSTYIRVVASLQPKELEISDPMKSLSDEKLAAAIAALTDTLRSQVPPTEPDEQRPTVN